MDILTYKTESRQYDYYLDKNGSKILHGEYKAWLFDGTIDEHGFFQHDILHGEYMSWAEPGVKRLYVNGHIYPMSRDMDEQEKLLFQIQHPGFRFIED